MKKSILFIALFSSFALAASTTVELNEVNDDGIGKSLGTIEITESEYGLVFLPNLKNLTVGIHGFHIHENPSCESTDKGPAMAAGGHFDPTKSGKHNFPWVDDGHLGDLPPLYVTSDGTSTQPVLSPKIKTIDEIKDHAIMIHVGGDNHSDTPQPLGGGGARMGCGVIK